MTRYARMALLVLALCAGGCLEEDDAEEECTPTPYDCEPFAPKDAMLHIEVSSPLPREVTIYAGSEFETGTVVWSGAPKGTSWSVRLPMGVYSATATYESKGKTVIAVDGDALDYSELDTCDGTCYETEDGLVDLALR